MSLSALPPAPSVADDQATFDSKGSALITALGVMVGEFNTDKSDIDAAVTSTSSSASTATTQAGIATTQAGIATTQAGNASTSAATATTQAGIATTQAQNANTSAIDAAASASVIGSAILRTSSTGSAILPAGTTAQQDVTPLFGYTRANSTLSRLEWSTSAIWKGIVSLTGNAIDFINTAGTFVSNFTNANTAARTYTFQDKSGTVAHLDDLSSTSAQNMTASSTAGALTVNIPAGSLNFHSTDLTLGNSVPVTFAALTITAASGSTFGIPNASISRVTVCVINNAGTGELALIVEPNTIVLNEMGLINTTAIGAAATGSQTFYSTAARTGVAYRVVGVIDVINNAGVWGSPSFVSGLYGQVSQNAVTAYGTKKAIFGYGTTGSAVSMTNLVSNTGVVATDATGVGTARSSLAAAGYGSDKAIFGYGITSSNVSMTNLVSNTGVVATDVTGVGTARNGLAAAGYGSDKAIFGYGYVSSYASMTNLVSNTGVVATDVTGVGTARYLLSAAGYGSDKAIFGYGSTGSNVSMTNLVSNTGVVAADVTGVGTARSSLAAAGYAS
jgi:hypothetical protein